MTEQEWLACNEPMPMLEFLQTIGKLTERKARLFTVAHCRQHWQAQGQAGQTAVEVAEKYADGLANNHELEAVRETFRDWNSSSSFIENSAWAATCDKAWEGARCVSFRTGGKSDWTQFTTARCAIVRDIFGNPFRPFTIDATWLTPNVVAVAHTIYDERRFQDMPILADALEEAGCTNGDILAHCRSEGPHVRGCWVVDLILGKQ
jgi:hypothetical protein